MINAIERIRKLVNDVSKERQRRPEEFANEQHSLPFDEAGDPTKYNVHTYWRFLQTLDVLLCELIPMINRCTELKQLIHDARDQGYDQRWQSIENIDEILDELIDYLPSTD